LLTIHTLSVVILNNFLKRNLHVCSKLYRVESCILTLSLYAKPPQIFLDSSLQNNESNQIRNVYSIRQKS